MIGQEHAPLARRAAALARVPAFAALVRPRLLDLAARFDEVTVADGTPLAVAGRPSHQVAVLLEGSLAECPIGVVGLGALLDGGISPETVTARGATRLLVAGEAELGAIRAALRESRRRQA